MVRKKEKDTEIAISNVGQKKGEQLRKGFSILLTATNQIETESQQFSLSAGPESRSIYEENVCHHLQK